MKTRSVLRKERQDQEQGAESVVQDEQSTKRVPETSKVTHCASEPAMAGSGVKAEPRPARMSTSVKSHKSSASSIEARKKRLLLEAEKRKAEIQMHLIDKELEADLADLEEEEYSSLEKEDCVRDVEGWMEKSQVELDKLLELEETRPDQKKVPIPTVHEPVAGTSQSTIQMLAATVQQLATASIHNKPNANLLSRICTPRDLPEFAGDPLDWLQFKRAYEESTEVCNFSPKENLWRLRKCLRGAARDAVSALLISATSPERIMGTLELRFGDPDYIISKLMQDVRRLQPVCAEYQKDIVQFSVKIQNFVEAVKSVGREEYLQGMGIVSLILSKLPTVLLSKWSDYSFPVIKLGKKSRLDILADFLSTEAIRISTTANIYTTSHRTEQYKNKPYDKSARPQTVLLQTHHEVEDKCQFCHKSKHKLSECKQFRKALRKVRWQHVKRNGICYKCLDSRHSRENCPAQVCDIDNCGQGHHKLLHFVNNDARQPPHERAVPRELCPTPAEPAAPEPSTAAAAGLASGTVSSDSVMNLNASSSKVFLKVVPIQVYTADGNVIKTSALLDDGSSVTIISADLARRAGLSGRQETMRARGPWNDSVIKRNITVVDVQLSGVDNKVHSVRAKSAPELDLPRHKLSVVDCTKYNHLKNIASSIGNINLKPELLIGQDNYHLLSPLRVILGNKHEPSATYTPLGICIHGPMRVAGAARGARAGELADESGASASVLFVAEGDRQDYELLDLHEEVRRGFALDALGVSGKPRQNADDVRAVEQLERTARLVDGRWHVGLPWTDPNCTMPDSFPNALRRLKGIERKMSHDPGFCQRYSERVSHLLENDFAKELTDTQRTSRTWYLPHFGVDNVNKKKMRLVFDAASLCDGLSLNHYLLRGPDLLNSLLGIMLRFREHKVAVTGDLKDMFLRVKILPQDQNALRFLWRSNPMEPVKTFIMTSLIFGAKCSSFVAQFIKNKNAMQYESSMPAAVDAIVNSTYMDDYIQSLPDEATAIQMIRDVTDIHKKGGFEMRNLTSNSAAVLDSIPKEALGTTAVNFKVDQQYEGQRTLGLLWYSGTDELAFDVSFKRIPDSIIQHKQRPSKRVMLRVVMSIFDVLGFLSPFTIQGRIMLQDTWRLGTSSLGWDEEIPDEVYTKWCAWIELLKVIETIRIPRCYQSSAASASETHSAPLTADSGVAVLRQPATSDVTQSRCYGAPGGDATSATPEQVIATKETIGTNGYYSNLCLHVFSDASTKAMCAVAYWRWINNGKIHISFIASKCRAAPVRQLTIPRLELQAAVLAARLADTVQREQKLSAVRRYMWCDSTTVLHWINNNTRTYKAYEANRLGEIDSLTDISEWRYVPTKLNVADIATRETFNYESFRGEWFKGPQFLYLHEGSWPLNVLEPETEDVFSGYVNELPVQENKCYDLPIPDPERFSSWLRLLRSAAVVLRFIFRCRKLTYDDSTLMDKAELLLLRQAQADSFGDEVAEIKKGKCVQRDSRLLTLSPYLDENDLLRMGGRIDAVLDVPLETKRPIILDGRHPVARLLVRHYHVKAAHGHQEAVVNNLKQKYWLLKLRPTVKYIASRCMLCRLRKAQPLVPRMGDLPAARLAHHQRCFTFCGLDLFGPMEVVVGRRREKRYGVLFTCLTIRAIHIEVVHSLTTDSLIMAIRRMASRRGWPSNFFSDNGTNLRGANTELKKAILEINNDILKTEAANNRAKWTFVPPRSPHWAGAWERLIRTVKTSLSVVLKERAPKDEVLLTLLAEVENIVNGRPLTHVSVEPGSLEALTPNHFLLGSSTNLPTAGQFDDSDLYLRKRWRTAQRLTDMYWRRWLKEYLPLLLSRKKWQQEQRPLCEGDLVLIADPDSPRNMWPRGLVKSVFPGRDGRIRVVEVSTQSGVLRRSAARVAPVPVES